MYRPNPEVSGLIERNLRVYEALRDAGITSEVICNALWEPLAVISRAAFDPSHVVGSTALAQAFAQETYDDTTVGEARRVLPISGPKVYPGRFLDIVDLVAQAAVTNSGDVGLATRLNGPLRGDDAFMVRDSSLGLHADFVGSTEAVGQELLLHGLNFHATRWGSALARLGIVRQLAYDAELASIKRGVEGGNLPPGDLDRAYERLAAPFAEEIVLNPGDLLVFQAQQHAGREIAGVAHDFATTSATRRSDVFTTYAFAIQPN